VTTGAALSDPENELAHFAAQGMTWVSTKAFEPALREAILPGLGSLEDAGATLLKRTLTRTVHRMAAGGTTVFVKHHRIVSLKERLKYLVLPSRASSEWEASRALRELAIPAARALAFGERRVAGVLTEAVLVSEEVADATPLGRALEEAGSKDEILASVAELVRRAHDRNVLHRDLHGGNILLAAGRPFFIDLHRMTIGRRVPTRRRIRNIGHLLAFAGDRPSDADRAIFVRAYLGSDAPEPEVDRLGRRVEHAARRLRERRYASRTKRCIGRSTGFRIERQGGMTVYRRADFEPDRVLEAIEQHRSTLADGPEEHVLKRDHRAGVTVVDLATPGGPQRLCVKEFVRPGVWRRLGDLIRGSRARVAWVGSNACRVRGIATPLACAAAEAGPRSYFITEYIDGAQRFNDYVADHGRPAGPAVARWRRFVLEAAEFVRGLHAHRLRHRDLSAKNILVRERGDGWDLYLVDMSDVRLGRAPGLDFKIRNLGQLDQIYVMPSRTDRLRFYRHYASGRPEFDDRSLLAEINATSRSRHENWLTAGGGAKILEERKQQGKPV